MRSGCKATAEWGAGAAIAGGVTAAEGRERVVYAEGRQAEPP
jgi:hypothetical protein